MSRRTLLVVSLLAGGVAIVSAVIASTLHLLRPYTYVTTILPATADGVAQEYAQEFADTLTITPENYVYLATDASSSPDGRFTWENRELANSYHEIIVTDSTNSERHTVAILQEADPGSGRSWRCHWSADSKALFIYGSGTPAGQEYLPTLSLVYVAGEQRLYSIDLEELIATRRQAM